MQAGESLFSKDPNETEPIVTDVDKVVKTLYSLTILMDARYDFLKQAGVKNIVEYNKKYLSGMLILRKDMNLCLM
jgi:S-DNA-T family DNA segregation ATPase FtsK/SpoIIIE